MIQSPKEPAEPITLRELAVRISALRELTDSKFDALHKSVDARFEALEKSVDARFASLEKTTETAYNAADKRLEGMNEFRDALKDQASRFVTREEQKLIVDRLENDIRNLQTAKAVLDSKASQSSVVSANRNAVFGLLIGVASLVASVVFFLLKREG